MSATTGYARNNIERFEENVQNQRPYNKSREKDRLPQIAGYGSLNYITSAWLIRFFFISTACNGTV